jgi:hypothetical protein
MPESVISDIPDSAYSLLDCRNIKMKLVSPEISKEQTPKEKIRTIALIFLSVSFVTFVFFISIAKEIVDVPVLKYFVIGNVTFTFVTGIGAYTLKRWGYYLLLINANLLSLGFPVGVYGIKLYRFLKQSDVKELFGIKQEKAV